MKQIIVMAAMIALGVALYQLIAGGDGSIAAALSDLWRHEIAIRTYTP